MTDLELQEQAEKMYPEYPTEPKGETRYNKDINCFKKRKAFIAGAKWMQERDEWISIEDRLPKSLQTVWLSNGNGFICLGCLVDNDDGWHWAESNGIIYIDNGEITSECESDDLDVRYWMPLPSPPKTK